MKNEIDFAIDLLKKSKHTTAFTGAGISVESGIPPFRGENGLWSKYDPNCLMLNKYLDQPEESWKIIREIFFSYFGVAKPNKAHQVLARMEKENMLNAVITMNIDNLHQEAGNTKVYEYHGNSKYMVCTNCDSRYNVSEIKLDVDYPKCLSCSGLLKPDFIFFGEMIPQDAHLNSIEEAKNAEVFIVVGTTGEVIPASHIPFNAKQSGTKIIEINPASSIYTEQITDIYLKGNAGEILKKIEEKLFHVDNSFSISS